MDSCPDLDRHEYLLVRCCPDGPVAESNFGHRELERTYGLTFLRWAVRAGVGDHITNKPMGWTVVRVR